MNPISIVLADDHHVVRQGLRLLLAQQQDFSIIAEASDGLETIQVVERLEPDILVVDLMMPGLNGFEVTRRTRKKSPKTHVVVLSMYGEESYVLEALRNGASAYVMKCSCDTELVMAIREAAAGRRYLSPPLSERAIEAYLQKAETTSLDMYETLTSREREILQLVAEGVTGTQIAARLFISRRTVETHRSNLMRKLGLKSQAEIIRYALKRGIVKIDG